MLQTLVAQFVVVLLTLRKCVVCCFVNLICNAVVVRSVVGDVQSAIAVDERQVAVTIETTHMVGTDGDEVSLVDVVDGCRGIAKHGGGIGKHGGRT